MPPKRLPTDSAPTSGKPSKQAKLRQVRPTTYLSGGGNMRAIGKGNAGILSSVRPLPGAIDVNNFVMARAFEITNIRNAMKTAQAAATTRAFQTLPRHLRRRAASHNARRVPLRLRSKAASEIAATDNTVKKQRKKEKKRSKGRRGETRTDVFRKRQRNKVWLETHIWHAKRMRMINIYGHRLAKTPTLKSHRPSHRAARNNCIIHDASYTSTIQLSGVREGVVRVLMGCTGGGSWLGGKYESGGRMAKTTFYGYQTWPMGMIGPIDILWCPPPPNPTSSPEIRLWLRCHPAITEQIYAGLQESASNLPHATDREGDEVRIEDLRGMVNAFEVMGPKAGKVLGGALGVCGGEGREKKQIWKWVKEAQTSAGLPERMVIGLEVHDPRLHFPPQNIPTTSTSSRVPDIAVITPSAKLSASGLWDRVGVDEETGPRFKKADLDKRRQDLGIPGTRLDPSSEDDRIPLLLIQTTTGSNTSNASHGYTLLLPSGWSMPFWQSLIFTGSLVAGQDEKRTQHFESATPSFPEMYPGTGACEGWWRAKTEEKDKRWRARPPAKRFNPGSLGLKMYRRPDWEATRAPEVGAGLVVDPEEEMMNKGTSEAGRPELQPYIVPVVLRTLCESLHAYTQEEQITRWASAVNKYRKSINLVPSTSTSQELYDSSLVRVELTTVGRGHPKDMAGIYSMSPAEVTAWRTVMESRDHVEPNSALVEMGMEIAKPVDLIGFVLMGGMSLSRGKGFGMGAVSLPRYVQALQAQQRDNGEGLFVRVRNDDEELSRMAQIDLLWN